MLGSLFPYDELFSAELTCFAVFTVQSRGVVYFPCAERDMEQESAACCCQNKAIKLETRTLSKYWFAGSTIRCVQRKLFCLRDHTGARRTRVCNFHLGRKKITSRGEVF